MTAAPLLSMEGISKAYPGVQALSGVELALARGEVLALLGENGAGKSTLMKILGGAVRPDAGTIRVDGVARAIRSPQEALRLGIAVIHQEFNLVPALGAAENVFLGQEIARGLPGLGVVDRRAQRARAGAVLARLGADFDPDTECRRLSVAGQQLVEIAKALVSGARILVMDEPSAALSAPEVAALHGVIRELKRDGTGIVYVSHRLDEIAAVCDRVAVLRDGRNAGGAAVAAVGRGDLIRMMVGRELTEEFPRRTTAPGEARLVVEGLSRGTAVRGVSFEARRGEVLAITGLVGAGRTELLRLLFGADRPDSGTIRLDGREIRPRSPRQAIAAGIGLLPEDRKLQGLVLDLSLRENFALPNLARLSRAGVVQGALERRECGGFVERLRIRTPRQEALVRGLSGGNQQKVVLAKWLARDCEVLLFDEPTRGVDVGAKVEIYRLINDLAAAGKVVVMVSSDLPEVLGMADRIVVMRGGRVTGRIDDMARATQESVMEAAVS